MGGEVSYVKNTNHEVPDNCKYCDKKFDQDKEVFEFYPHEAGGYCIFAPRDGIDYSCSKCAYKVCESCKKEKFRHGFIECVDCEITHCWNNTDMCYEGNPMLGHLDLCRAKNCMTNRKRDDEKIDNNN